MIHLVRAAVVFGFWGICLRTMGYHLKWEEALIVVWGGLRGAVGLALALIIENSNNNEYGREMMFLVSGICVLTMVINGTTTGLLYSIFNPYHPMHYTDGKKDTALRQDLIELAFTHVCGLQFFGLAPCPFAIHVLHTNSLHVHYDCRCAKR